MFEALEMAEGVGRKFESVLKKLEKLDAIESCLSHMHTMLESIEENVSRLDQEVVDLKTKSKQLGSTINELKESIQFNEEDMTGSKLDNKKLQQDVCELQKQFFLHGNVLKARKCKICGVTRKAG